MKSFLLLISLLLCNFLRGEAQNTQKKNTDTANERQLQVFSQQTSILFKNVNVVDVQKGIILPKQNVFVEGNQIKKISSKPIDVNGATVLNGSGKYLLPGLCDFNAYVLQYEFYGVPAFKLMLANGVTSVRDLLPPNNLPDAFAIKKSIESRIRLAPRLYLSGKTIIDRLPFQNENINKSLLVTSVNEAEAAVDSLIELGADVIDIRTILNEPILRAITNRAHQKGLKVMARYSGNWMTASDNGIDAFTHPSDLWRVIAKGREKLFKFSADDSMRLVTVPEFYNRVLPSLGAVDTPYFKSLINAFKKNNTGICTNFSGHMPSRIRFEINDTSRNAYRITLQKKLIFKFMKNYDQITFAQARGETPQTYFVVQAAKQGAMIIAGTQMEEFMTPGMSLHDELHWLVVGGLTAAEALRTATINPALFLNKQKLLGTVEVGKLADLVLLDANPLQDISNIRKINAVVANGRLLKRNDLDKMLEDAKQKVKISNQPQN